MAVKLGNGNWAVKEDKLLAYNDNSGLFFNKEFDFSRGTSATYVAKDGLIKTAGIQPNIVNNGDFSDGTNNWETEGNSSITVGTYEGRSNVANINILNTSTSSRIRQPFNYVNGKKYKVTVNVFLVSGSFRVDCRDSFVSGDFVSTSTTGSWLTLSAEIDAISTGTDNVWLRSLSAVSQFYVDNISVQEIQTDTPRIDFTNDTKGHLLLEPSSTNLLTYSEDFTQWDKNSGTTITSNSVISPDGTQNATKVVSAGTGSRVGLNTSIVSGTTYTLSVYLKNNGGNTSVSIGSHGTTQLETVTINNEWNRYTTTFVASSTTTSSIRINSSGSNINLYAWGAMLETKGYATSYIPTTGATSTRNADVCNNSGSAQDFNSEEGVLYAEIAALTQTLGSSDEVIGISDGTLDNRIIIYHKKNLSNTIAYGIESNNVAQFFESFTISDITSLHKVAFKFKQNDCALWINGNEVDTQTSVSMPSGLNSLQFDTGNGSSDFYGKVRNVQVFTEALTDEQLEKLTS